MAWSHPLISTSSLNLPRRGSLLGRAQQTDALGAAGTTSEERGLFFAPWTEENIKAKHPKDLRPKVVIF